MKENEMVFGIRAVIEAIQADKEIDKILVKRELQGDLSRELFEVLKGRDIPVQRVPAERLDRLTRKNHQGVIAFIPAITYERLENIIPFVYEQGKNPFIVLLDGVTDVRNFGAIARTCECAGLDPATGNFAEGGVKEQTVQAFKNVHAILEEAGLSINDVVKTTVFLADMSDFAAMNEVYASQFEGTFPARSAVAVKTLPKNGLVEIEVIAVKE